MPEATTNAKVDRPKLGVRAGASRKLLEKKAAERAAAGELADGKSLEADFPASPLVDVDAAAELTVPAAVEAPVEAPEALAGATALPVPSGAADDATGLAEVPTGPWQPAAAQAPAAAQPWSDEDERAFQDLAARRRGAGYQRRGRDVGGQLITAGTIKPNDNTVVAVIVGLVAERGSIGRAELLEVMATTTFPHRAARPDDRGWCQGYVAGAVRDGFLALAEQPAVVQEAA